MITREENLKVLDKRISQLSLKGNVVLCFDFDELVVPIHLSRIVTQKVAGVIDKKELKKYIPSSFEEIKYLNSLFYGYDLREYKELRDKIVEETPWTKGFDKLLKKLIKKYSVIFISCGMKDICEAKLNEIGFDSNGILAGEFRFEENKIVGTNLIISDELKGYIIRRLKKNHKVISIGHSLGDKIMLDNSDVSISVNSGMPNLAQFNVKSTKELLEIIKKHL